MIDHILTNASDKITQSGVIDIGLSDHQLIFCTRKVTKFKTGKSKLISFRSMKHYTENIFKEKLSNVKFPNYENFSDINSAYSDFSGKLLKTIDNIAPMQQSKIRNNSQEWFDGEVAEKIATRDRLFKKLKKTKLHIDMDLFREARNKVESLIKKKKKRFFCRQVK